VLRDRDSPPWKQCTQAKRFIAIYKQIEQEGTGARLAIERLCRHEPIFTLGSAVIAARHVAPCDNLRTPTTT
jgi:hypothetical protein